MLFDASIAKLGICEINMSLPQDGGCPRHGNCVRLYLSCLQPITRYDAWTDPAVLRFSKLFPPECSVASEQHCLLTSLCLTTYPSEICKTKPALVLRTQSLALINTRRKFWHSPNLERKPARRKP